MGGCCHRRPKAAGRYNWAPIWARCWLGCYYVARYCLARSAAHASPAAQFASIRACHRSRGWIWARYWTLDHSPRLHARRLKARRNLATRCHSGTAKAAYSAAPDSGRRGASRFRYAPWKPARQTCSSRPRSLRFVRSAQPKARLNGRRQFAIRPLPGSALPLHGPPAPRRATLASPPCAAPRKAADA